MRRQEHEEAHSQIDERNERVMPSSFIHAPTLPPEEAARRDSREVIEAHQNEIRRILLELTEDA